MEQKSSKKETTWSCNDGEGFDFRGQKGWTEGGQSRGHRSFRLFLLE